MSLTEIPGIGPVTSTALIAAVGNASAFRKWRDLSALMGIVPKECSTGGKQKLLGISKRGNAYLLQPRHRQAPGLSSWLAQKRNYRSVHTRMWSSWPWNWFAWLGRSCARTKAIALLLSPYLRKIPV